MRTTAKIISNPKTEAQHQHNVITWSELHIDKYPELALLHHIPNGGNRDAVEGKHLKDQGVKRGIPDLHLPIARGQYHSLYLEMKTETGRPTREQKWWIEQLNKQGQFAEICHGWESAVRVLEWYLNLKDSASEKKEYIEREEAKRRYCENFCYPGPLCPDFRCSEVRGAFDGIPFADVVPWSWLAEYAEGKRCNYASDFVIEAKEVWSNAPT